MNARKDSTVDKTFLTINQLEAYLNEQLDRHTVSADEYLPIAEKLLLENGYSFVNSPCDCQDRGEFGHHFACGFEQ